MGIFSRRTQFDYYPPMPFEIDLRQRLPQIRYEKLRVLNVGVGVGNSGLAHQLPFFPFGQLDHLDVHQPYLDAAAARSWAAKKVKFIKGDIRQFNTVDYNLVLMFDVLEHLPKDQSMAVIRNIKCKQVIFIPLEKEFRKNEFGAESQDHLSIWREYDFRHLGYATEVLKNFHHDQKNVWDALWALK